ncbi:MAG: signal transduction protein [Halomonadaceae bacterium]|nr:signal transduction protein [Halomonadaceae bacterium]
MTFLYRHSPWRALFAGEALPEPAGLSSALTPLVDALESLGPTPSLAAAKAWQLELVEALTRLDLPAWRISQLISDHDQWLYRQAIAASLDEMRATGWGAPPRAFCVLVLGSIARHESLLSPDQDNAMIIGDYPDARHTEIDGYFQALGERFSDRLAVAGLPLCQGHVMARWPMWRKRLCEWDAQLAIWSAERRVKRVQQTNILLDFSPVFGDAGLADALRDRALARLARAGGFLDEMASLLEETPVALDRLGRLHGDDKESPQSGAVNLKRQGLIPLQNAVRLMSLLYGCRGVDTRLRLTELACADALGVREAMTLHAAMSRLQALLLASQCRRLRAGGLADGWILLDDLDEAEQVLLRLDLKAIRRLMGRASALVGATSR